MSVIILIILCSCDNENELYYTINFTVNSEEGYIEGLTTQTIVAGGSSQKVIAKAKEGYYFAGWSDQNALTDETVLQAERVIENVRESRAYLAMFEKITVNIQYICDEHGSIEGMLVQNVKYGENATSVTAVPNKGYRFIGWSDNIDTPTRQDVKLIENKQVTAYFEIITKLYTYNYKNATENCNVKDVMLTYGQLKNAEFVIPIRENCIFDGWYADKKYSVKVADKNGNIVTDDELFYMDSTTLYAKWISENDNTFKLLLVYVTELNAELTTVSGTDKILVNYKMTETEREICHIITEKINWWLNDLSIANFQVDEYFTTIPLTEENITEGMSGKYWTNSVFGYNIPEISDIISDYQSVLISYSMDDYCGNLHNNAGEAAAKYGCVHFDAALYHLILNDEPIDYLLDKSYWRWDYILDSYLHEFAHTVQMRINAVSLHEVLNLDYDYRDPLKEIRLYLLNQAVVNGEPVGIPYEFWQGKVVKVYYESQEGGYIQSHGKVPFIPDECSNKDSVLYVIYGNDGVTVTAEAFSGYEFVGWSDGVTTASRKDFNLCEDKHIIAYFRKIE